MNTVWRWNVNLQQILNDHKLWLDADLSRADLSRADLWNCNGNRRQIKTIHCVDTYPITYTSDVLQIGCKRYPIEEWWMFDDKEILEMDGKTALKFWREWKETIRMIIEKSPAEKTNENQN